MNNYIGIDLGTSGVKVIVVSENGKIIGQETETYSVSYPHNGWSEQSPELWYDATLKCLEKLNAKDVRGISFGGQMHGLVVLDKDDKVIRPCILWNDGRTKKETEYLNTVIGTENLSKYTNNIAFAGFTAPKILWLKENEPENFKKIAKIMLPKDYLAFRMTGKFATDYSDASGMLLLDVKNKRWSKEMCDICSISENMLPKLCESYDVIGTLNKDIEEKFGYKDVKVCIGAGDNAAAAIGTGTVSDGDCNISLGTSGTIFICNDKMNADGGAIHAFCHANGKYHLMGCILSAASCNGWWTKDILNADFADVESTENILGKNEIFFLPYLMGERSPHNDVDARGVFFGLTPATTKEEMSLSVLEGVSFAVRDCLEYARANGADVKSSTICGGGAKGTFWVKVIANILNIPIKKVVTEQGPSYGAAILAMVGCGAYKDVKEATEKLIEVSSVTYPDENIAKLYDKKYKVFCALYPALKDVYKLARE